MLQILGWVVVVWLLGSTIYSTQFHLGNYFRSKDKETVVSKDLEYSGQELILTKKVFLQRVLTLQIVKIVIAILLIYLIT